MDSADEFRAALVATLLAEGRVEAPKRPRLETVNMASVEASPVEWLWEDRIPYGGITMLYGEGDIGKSWLVTALLHAYTTGSYVDSINLRPDGPGRAVVFALEDSLSKTWANRFASIGFDGNGVEMVKAQVKLDDRGVDAMIETALDEKARLIVIDPLSNYYPKGVNPSFTHEVRPVIQGIQDKLEPLGIAVLALGHTSKRSDVSAKYALMGSTDIVNAMRSAFMVAWHPEVAGRRCLLHTKANWSPCGLTRTVEFSLRRDLGFVWNGESDVSETDLEEGKKTARAMNKGGRPPEQRQKAREVLEEMLVSHQGRVHRETAIGKAAVHGVSRRTLERVAEQDLGLMVEGRGRDSFYVPDPFREDAVA